MTIIPFEPAHRPQFETMLVDYFNELSSGIPESVIRGKIMELFLGEQSLGIIQIAIALDDDTPIGFSAYQIDAPKSDWCKRPRLGQHPGILHPSRFPLPRAGYRTGCLDGPGTAKNGRAAPLSHRR